MPTDRYAVVRGPALCVFRSGGAAYKLISEGDVAIDYGIATADQAASFAGTIETFRTGVSPAVSFTPLGLTTYFALLSLLATMKVGQTMVGALVDPDGAGAQPAAMADNTLTVQPFDATQQQQTFYGVGINAVPNVNFAADAPLFDGSLNFRVCGKNNVAPDAANRLYLKEANTIGADGIGYDSSKLIRQAYTITHAQIAGGAAFDTAAGAKLSFGLKVNEYKSNSVGVYDVGFGGLTPVVTLVPVGISDDALAAALHLQGAGSQIGTKLSAAGGDLVISGTGVYAKLPLAGVRKAGVVRGATADLLSAVDFVGAVSVDANGNVAPRFVLATQAPA